MHIPFCMLCLISLASTLQIFDKHSKRLIKVGLEEEECIKEEEEEECLLPLNTPSPVVCKPIKTEKDTRRQKKKKTRH